MEVFPTLTSIPPDNPIEETINFKNIQASFGREAEERKKKEWDYPKRDISLKYNRISASDALTLWQFYLARGGSFEAFYFIHPFINDYEEEFVDICPGNLEYFLLPSKGATNYTLYANGVALNAGSDYYFYSQGSPDGIDYVEVYPPEQGTVLSWSFTGRLVQRARFEDDSLSFETFYNRLSNIGLKLKGLLFSEQFGYAHVTSPFFFDEFDDQSIDSHWSLINPSNIEEGADGKLWIKATAATLYQEDIVLGTTFFDIYTRFDSFTKTPGADGWWNIYLVWGTSTSQYPRVNLAVYWDESQGNWRAWFIEVNASNQTSVETVTFGPTMPEKIWFRLSYQFGDSFVRGWYATSQPVGDAGWTEFGNGPYHCVPQSGIASLHFKSVGNAVQYKIDYFRDTFETPGPQTTTSTTT
jgi:hypothetical protein